MLSSWLHMAKETDMKKMIHYTTETEKGIRSRKWRNMEDRVRTSNIYLMTGLKRQKKGMGCRKSIVEKLLKWMNF